VGKINLSNFTLAGTLTFNSSEGGVASAAIDTLHQFAYFGTHDSPGKIIQVRLSDFTRSGAVTLQPGQNDLTSAVVDPSSQYAYFGTNTSPGIVVRVSGSFAGLAGNTALTLATGENYLRSAAIDPANGYAYFGTFVTTASVVLVDLLAGPPEISLQPQDAQAHTGESAFFSVLSYGRGMSYQWQINGVNIPGATSAAYTRTVLITDDGSAFQCVITGTNGTTTSRSALLTVIPVVRAYPNPWRADRHTGLGITFDGLLPNSTVKIFNLAAHWVRTLPLASGSAVWDRTNDAGQTVASGYYFYLVTTGNDRQTVHGKFAIIK
jgi:hypothetical protein